jgi:hypothetical protein
MVFAQLTYHESLRDIEACLGSRRRLLYHSGIRGTVKRCNLACANDHRDARMFAQVAAVLMRRARRLYADGPTELGLDGDLVKNRICNRLYPNLRKLEDHLLVALRPWRTDATKAAQLLDGGGLRDGANAGAST